MASMEIDHHISAHGDLQWSRDAYSPRMIMRNGTTSAGSSGSGKTFAKG